MLKREICKNIAEREKETENRIGAAHDGQFLCHSSHRDFVNVRDVALVTTNSIFITFLACTMTTLGHTTTLDRMQCRSLHTSQPCLVARMA